MWRELAAMNVVPRWTVIGGMVLGGIGAAVGLIVGLLVHPPTAWAALFELGIPSAVLGALIGVLVGLVLSLRQRRHSLAPR